jgi:hypothetical protein
VGLFDFFKKKTTSNLKPEYQPIVPGFPKNWTALGALASKLGELGYQVNAHSDYTGLIVSDELEIEVAVVDVPGAHPSLMQMMVRASHPKYFPEGIVENVVGIGQSTEVQIDSALQNYIDSTFLTIMDSFTDTHCPELDFLEINNGREVLWHPKLGNLVMQGQWMEQPQGEPFFELLKHDIPGQLTTNKINWLKIYISKRADGEIIGECNFNNQPWEAATNKIYNYAAGWDMPGEFKGLKQFIMFRRCDAYDENPNSFRCSPLGNAVLSL